MTIGSPYSAVWAQEAFLPWLTQTVTLEVPQPATDPSTGVIGGTPLIVTVKGALIEPNAANQFMPQQMMPVRDLGSLVLLLPYGTVVAENAVATVDGQRYEVNTVPPRSANPVCVMVGVELLK